MQRGLKKKKPLVCYCFPSFGTRQALIDYECIQGFFRFIKVEKILNMHWTTSNGWGMVGIYLIPLLDFFLCIVPYAYSLKIPLDHHHCH
jgi:hypothetical protein